MRDVSYVLTKQPTEMADLFSHSQDGCSMVAQVTTAIDYIVTLDDYSMVLRIS